MSALKQSLKSVQSQSQKQKQVQKFSQMQIQGMSFLSMDSLDLRNEIIKAAGENPAVKVVFKHNDKVQDFIENTESHGETLQSHLLHQLNSMNLSDDERELSEKLIYNLDENGFYGSMLSPSFLLNKVRPLQNEKMLSRCIERIQQMDPVGTCCKGPEESLFVQAKLSENHVPDLALFFLDGKLELLDSMEPSVIVKKLESYRFEWHKKAFAPEILLDKVELSEQSVSEAIKFILTLNPRPAQGFDYDISSENFRPDVVVSIKKISGKSMVTDYSRGIVAGGKDYYFQIKYASDVLPEVSVDEKALPESGSNVSKEYDVYRKNCISKALELVNNLIFRESTIILQACAIVNSQKDFFENGSGPVKALTRRQIANELGVHESCLSRTSNRKNSKFFQTDYGVFPASYFFSSGVEQGEQKGKISQMQIKWEISNLVKNAGNFPLSDQKLVELLFERGIKISRRTVNKYRNQLGIKNSYSK